MATTGTNEPSAGVLLVDADTILLQGGNEEDPTDVTADLLQQALQGASTLNASDDPSEGVREVKFDTMSESTNDVVAIFQNDSGETHTIKMTREQLESLGLQLDSKTTDVDDRTNSVINSVPSGTPTPAENLITTSQGILPIDQNGLLPSLPSMVTEGRIIDEEGNIVQADNVNILPTSLSSFMEQDVSQAITIVPQYGADGTLTYAVKLKGDDDLSASNYTLTTSDVISKEDEPKTGLDIEVEMARVNAKRSLESLEEAIGSVAIPISSSGVVPISTAMSLPTLPLTATIPRVTNSNKFVSVVPSSAPTTGQNSYFRILPDRSAMNLGALASAVQPNVDLQPLQTSLTNVVPDPVVRPVVSKLQSPIAFPFTASTLNTTLASGRTLNTTLASGRTLNTTLASGRTLNTTLASGRTLNTTLASGRTLNVSTNSQLGLNVFSIMNPSDEVPATSTTTFRSINSNSVAMKPLLKTAPSRVSNFQTTTSRLLPVASSRVTGVNVLPSPSTTIMTSATTTQPAIAAAAITKVCQPTSAAGSRAPNHFNTKPLGSSENPIQLVQQGQTFHSMQALSQSQLHQIATVLQQKHIGGMPKKNVVFDEQTKTRIVYRVVYPEDVDLQQPNSPIEGRDATALKTSVQPEKAKPERRRGRPAKPRAHFRPSASENQNPEGDDDEDTVKNERKKVIARTRSGRLSRPPRHMIKDYKRLHHLDFWEPDLDDSDGGYSDYLPTVDQTGTTNPANPPNPANPADAVPANSAIPGTAAAIPTEEDAANKGKELLNGTVAVKRRTVSSRFICSVCQKIYLGHSRMARHLQRFPDHGSLEEFNAKAADEMEKNGENGESNGKKKVVDFKRRGARGRKRSYWNQRTPQEISEQRKNKLRQMIATCETHELVEVVGPLIARTLTLWDLLLLRLESLDRAKNATGQADSKADSNPQEGDNENNEGDGTREGERDRERSHSNRVAWLLIELRSLLDSVQSIAGDLLKPQGVPDCSVENVVEIAEQALSNMLGMACGTYIANDRLLHPQRDEPPEVKRSRIEDEITVPDSEECSEVLPDVEMTSKEEEEEPKSLSPIKLSDHIPFLNSSDDMICAGDDPDASTDGKHCDAAAGLQTVDDIVNERLKNLEENMNFSVSLSGQLEPPISSTPADLLMSDFAAATDSVNTPSVITNTVPDSGSSVGVSSMDLLNSYDSSISALTGSVPINGGVGITNSPSSGDLAGSLSSGTNQDQEMLSRYSMDLSSLGSLGSYVSIPTTTSDSHTVAADNFLDSLSSFGASTCGDTGVGVPSFGDSVLKDTSVLPVPLSSEHPPTRRQSPPKFISTFTPAETLDKPSEPITTAQRLQRDYRFSERSIGLELDSSLDVGLDTDLVFEALTEELNCSTQN